MNFYLKRTWDVVISLFAITLSLALQYIFFVLLSFGVIGLSDFAGMPLSKDFPFALLIVFFYLVFNGLACWEYFRKRKHAEIIRKDGSVLLAVVRPDSGHLTGAIFLVPRGIDRILTGTELTMQKPDEEQEK